MTFGFLLLAIVIHGPMVRLGRGPSAKQFELILVIYKIGN